MVWSCDQDCFGVLVFDPFELWNENVFGMAKAADEVSWNTVVDKISAASTDLNDGLV